MTRPDLNFAMDQALAAAPLVRTRWGWSQAKPGSDPCEAHHAITVAALIRRGRLRLDASGERAHLNQQPGEHP